MDLQPSAISRRQIMKFGTVAAAGLFAERAMAALPGAGGVRPDLMRRAMAALEKHGSAITNRDTIAIADFSATSAAPRFHVVDMISGRATTMLVSHGRGSDPAHSGFVERFSNDFGSAASSRGAYRTGDLYVGKHGRSRRLIGLDPTNSNAEPRAVVIHAAWYVSPEMVAQHGKIGRSEGCFAVSEANIEQVLARMGTGRLLYAEKA